MKKGKNNNKNKMIVRIAGGTLALSLLFGGIMIMIKYFHFNPSDNNRLDYEIKHDPDLKDLTLEDVIIKVSEEYNIDENKIKNRLFPGNNLREIEIHIPRGVVDELVVWNFQKCIHDRPYKLEKSAEGKGNRICTMFFKSLKNDLENIKLSVYRTSGFIENSYKMGIIIKNFDYQSMKSFPDIASIDVPITLAMLPGDDINRAISKIMSKTQNRILVQLPFEKFRNNGQHKDFIIKIHYKKEKLHKILDRCFEMYPEHTGVIHCGGDMILKDSRIMGIILSYIKNKHSFFIEDNSELSYDFAAETGCPYLTAEKIMPDTSDISTSLEKNLRKQILVAQQFGYTVITIEYLPELIPFLKKFMPVIKSNGVEIVNISDIPMM